MVQIEETRGLGIHCGGKACPILAILISCLTLATSLAYSLVTRIYIQGYYTSAHVSAIITFISAFVLAHHLMRVRHILGCGPRSFIIIQLLLNLWLLLCALTISVAYTLLAAWTSPNNLDIITAAVWGWLGVLMMVYLTVLAAIAIRGDWYSSYDLATTRTSFVYHSAQDLPLKDLSSLSSIKISSKDSLVPNKEKDLGINCKNCCKVYLRVILGFLYTVFQIIFAMVIFMSAYHPCGVLADWKNHRPTDDLYTVTVGEHQPVSLFMKCRGEGNETIVYENGLGAVAITQWNFLPRFLEKDFRVCVHDRRSYGWSQGLENDFIPTIRDTPQDPVSSTEYLRALVQEAGIQSPFYYAGHSYGGHHITNTAILYPDLVKGLVFLDSSKFSVLEPLMIGTTSGSTLELAANFFPLGLVRAALSCCVDGMKLLQDIMYQNIDDLPDNIEEETFAVFRSTDIFTGILREYDHVYKSIPEPYRTDTVYLDRYPELQLRSLLERSAPVDKPVLVVDAGNRRDWFPKGYFSQFSNIFHVSFPMASHTSLVYTEADGNHTAQIIKAFIHNVQSVITNDEFQKIKEEMGGE